MMVRVVDREALERLTVRSIVLYLATHGWVRRNASSVWSLNVDADEFEVLPPASNQVPGYAGRVAELLSVLSAVESRSELEILQDLVQTRYDVQRYRVDYDGPAGTAPLGDAARAMKSAQSALLAAASSLELPDRPVLPTRSPALAAEVSQRALAGPTADGSFVFSVWVPVPPRLVPPADQVLFSDSATNEPFERRATLRLMDSFRAVSEAVGDYTNGLGDISAFMERIDRGVTATFCEAVAGIVADSRIGLETGFSWAIDRPVLRPSPPILLPRGSDEILTEAAREMRDAAEEENVAIVGNVVRLHREIELGPGEITVAGVLADDPTEKLRRVALSVSEDEYELAMRAHREFFEVRVAGELFRRGNRSYLRNPREFSVRPSDD